MTWGELRDFLNSDKMNPEYLNSTVIVYDSETGEEFESDMMEYDNELLIITICHR